LFSLDSSSISDSVSTFSLFSIESSTTFSSVGSTDASTDSGSVSSEDSSFSKDFNGVSFLYDLEGRDLLLTGVFFNFWGARDRLELVIFTGIKTSISGSVSTFSVSVKTSLFSIESSTALSSVGSTDASSVSGSVSSNESSFSKDFKGVSLLFALEGRDLLPCDVFFNCRGAFKTSAKDLLPGVLPGVRGLDRAAPFKALTPFGVTIFLGVVTLEPKNIFTLAPAGRDFLLFFSFFIVSCERERLEAIF